MCCQTASWTRSQNRSWCGCVGAFCQTLPCTPTTGALPCTSLPQFTPFPHALPCSLFYPALAFILPCPAVKPALPQSSLCLYQICQICPLQLLVDITVASLKHASLPALHIALSSVILACTLHPLIACSGSSPLKAQHMNARQLHFLFSIGVAGIWVDAHTHRKKATGIQDTVLSGRAEGHSSMAAGAGAGHSPRASPPGSLSSPGGCSVSARLGTSEVICLRTNEV